MISVDTPPVSVAVTINIAVGLPLRSLTLFHRGACKSVHVVDWNSV
jgi:hypothetical protein